MFHAPAVTWKTLNAKHVSRKQYIRRFLHPIITWSVLIILLHCLCRLAEAEEVIARMSGQLQSSSSDSQNQKREVSMNTRVDLQCHTAAAALEAVVLLKSLHADFLGGSAGQEIFVDPPSLGS